MPDEPLGPAMHELAEDPPGTPLPRDGSQEDPLDGSLLGEYLRLIMIGTTVCAGVFWASQVRIVPFAPLMIVTCILILGVLNSRRFAGLLRLATLCSLAIGLAVVVGANGDWLGPVLFFSPAVLLGMLVVLSLRDATIVLRARVQNLSYRTIALGIGILVAFLYLVVAPVVGNVLEQFEERPTSYVIEELSAWEELRVRSAKLIVFLIFAYFGACIGSFLNVVAASAPRGESVVIRNSSCPNCGTPIRRIDNFPIVSYLVLHGQCRACHWPIPVRYLAVELIAMFIFASLFLYELVTGAANVPGLQVYHHAGILWIILYTKWPVVGIYFYHGMMFSCLLMLALMEADGLRCPKRMAAALIGLFAVAAVASPLIQPVAFDDQLPVHLSATIPLWVERIVTCLSGAVAGWLIAMVTSRMHPQSPPILAFLLLGVSLGWQATLTIGIAWVIASLIVDRLSTSPRPSWLFPTALLFGVATVHHPFWKTLASFWW